MRCGDAADDNVLNAHLDIPVMLGLVVAMLTLLAFVTL